MKFNDTIFGRVWIYFQTLLLCLLCISLTSCHTFRDPNKFVKERAVANQFHEANIPTSFSTIRGYHKPFKPSAKTLRIYLEGDGNAWADRFTPSNDPTPKKNITGFELALSDPSPNVTYLARPCQFNTSKKCNYHYWTDARFNKKIVSAISEAIDTLKDKGSFKSIELVGFSGGGSIAILLAEHREDINHITTVASVLDHKAWTKWHKVSPLTHSLNPASKAPQLTSIKQTHICGTSDTIVPCALTKNAIDYHYAPATQNPIQFLKLKGMKHSSPWHENWPKILQKIYG